MKRVLTAIAALTFAALATVRADAYELTINLANLFPGGVPSAPVRLFSQQVGGGGTLNDATIGFGGFRTLRPDAAGSVTTDVPASADYSRPQQYLLTVGSTRFVFEMPARAADLQGLLVPVAETGPCRVSTSEPAAPSPGDLWCDPSGRLQFRAGGQWHAVSAGTARPIANGSVTLDSLSDELIGRIDGAVKLVTDTTPSYNRDDSAIDFLNVGGGTIWSVYLPLLCQGGIPTGQTDGQTLHWRAGACTWETDDTADAGSGLDQAAVDARVAALARSYALAATADAAARTALAALFGGAAADAERLPYTALRGTPDFDELEEFEAAFRTDVALATNASVTVADRNTWYAIPGDTKIPDAADDREVVFTVRTTGEPDGGLRSNLATLLGTAAGAAGGAVGVGGVQFGNPPDDNRYWLGRSTDGKFLFATDTGGTYLLTLADSRLDVTQHVGGGSPKGNVEIHFDAANDELYGTAPDTPAALGDRLASTTFTRTFYLGHGTGVRNLGLSVATPSGTTITVGDVLQDSAPNNDLVITVLPFNSRAALRGLQLRIGGETLAFSSAEYSLGDDPPGPGINPDGYIWSARTAPGWRIPAGSVTFEVFEPFGPENRVPEATQAQIDAGFYYLKAASPIPAWEAVPTGLTQAQVDSRVAAGTLAQARAGNTSRWPPSKLELPADVVTNGELAALTSTTLAADDSVVVDDESVSTGNPLRLASVASLDRRWKDATVRRVAAIPSNLEHGATFYLTAEDTVGGYAALTAAALSEGAGWYRGSPEVGAIAPDADGLDGIYFFTGTGPLENRLAVLRKSTNTRAPSQLALEVEVADADGGFSIDRETFPLEAATTLSGGGSLTHFWASAVQTSPPMIAGVSYRVEVEYSDGSKEWADRTYEPAQYTYDWPAGLTESGRLSEAAVDARVVAGTRVEARAGNADPWPLAKLPIWTGTLAAYNALAAKSATTLYLVTQ